MIVKNKKKDRYTQVENELAQNRKVSYPALGLWVYLISRPFDWEVHIKDLQNRFNGSSRDTVGADTVRKLLRELESHGLARLVTGRKKDGTVSGKHWEIYNEVTEIGKTPKSVKHRRREKPVNRETPKIGFPIGIQKKEGITKKDPLKKKEGEGKAFSQNGKASAETKPEPPPSFEISDIEIQEEETPSKVAAKVPPEDPAQIITKKILQATATRRDVWQAKYNVNGTLERLAEFYGVYWSGRQGDGISDAALMIKARNTGAYGVQSLFESSLLSNENWQKEIINGKKQNGNNGQNSKKTRREQYREKYEQGLRELRESSPNG